MPDDLKSFVGASLRSVEIRDYSWFFRFDAPLLIATESPWRFLIPGRIKVTSEDHGHPFGLPQPVDAVERVMSRLAGLHVQAVSCDATTGDLFVSFGDGLCLQFLQMSCGYESWRATTEHGESICLGGGERIEFIPNTKNS